MAIKIELKDILKVTTGTALDYILIAYGADQVGRLLPLTALVAQSPRVTSSVNGITYQISVLSVDGAASLSPIAVPSTVSQAVAILCPANGKVYAVDILIVDGYPTFNLTETSGPASTIFNILCTDNSLSYQLAVLIVDSIPTLSLIQL